MRWIAVTERPRSWSEIETKKQNKTIIKHFSSHRLEMSSFFVRISKWACWSSLITSSHTLTIVVYSFYFFLTLFVGKVYQTERLSMNLFVYNVVFSPLFLVCTISSLEKNTKLKAEYWRINHSRWQKEADQRPAGFFWIAEIGSLILGLKLPSTDSGTIIALHWIVPFFVQNVSIQSKPKRTQLHAIRFKAETSTADSALFYI